MKNRNTLWKMHEETGCVNAPLVRAVVPKLFRCADHFESFGGSRGTKKLFVYGDLRTTSANLGPPVVR